MLNIKVPSLVWRPRDWANRPGTPRKNASCGMTSDRRVRRVPRATRFGRLIRLECGASSVFPCEKAPLCRVWDAATDWMTGRRRSCNPLIVSSPSPSSSSPRDDAVLNWAIILSKMFESSTLANDTKLISPHLSRGINLYKIEKKASSNGSVI